MKLAKKIYKTIISNGREIQVIIKTFMPEKHLTNRENIIIEKPQSSASFNYKAPSMPALDSEFNDCFKYGEGVRRLSGVQTAKRNRTGRGKRNKR